MTGVHLSVWVVAIRGKGAGGGPCRVSELIVLVQARKSRLGDVARRRSRLCCARLMMIAKCGVFVWRLARFHGDGPVHGGVDEGRLDGWLSRWVLNSPIRTVVTVHCLLIVRVTFIYFYRIYS